MNILPLPQLLRSGLRPRSWVAAGIALGLLTPVLGTLPAIAEGSRSLYPSGITGNRANLEWRTSNYANGLLKRRTLLKVYVNAGEYILLGSSAVGVTSGTTSGNIQVYGSGRVTGSIGQETIPTSADFSCSDQRTTTGNTNQGRITTREAELAGPDTITNSTTATAGGVVTNGYVPCFYQAPTTGIYYVVFSGPLGTDSDTEMATVGSGSLNSPNISATQNASVSMWDVTIRDSLTSTVDRNGRLFADYLAMIMGANDRYMNSKLVIVTRDGFRYKTDLGGIDPNGFVIFANNVGFYDSDRQTPLYRDVLGGNNQLTALSGGVAIALPSHEIFFTNTNNVEYQPDDDAIAANFIPLAPTNPILSALTYQGSAGGTSSYLNSGGVFTIETSIEANYQLVISRNGTDFDPTNPDNRVLRGVRSAGTSTIVWNGLDNNGTAFPVGTYSVKARIHSGEYHFPLLDVENSKGGPRYNLINPPTGSCSAMALGLCTSAYYDDRGYRTLNGTTVGTVNTILPGNSPPSTSFTATGFDTSSAGFDTTTDQRQYGNSGIDGFGDTKGLDLWTFFPSDPREVTVEIIDRPTRDVTIFKSHVGNFRVGSTGTYTIRVRNNGSQNIPNGQTITVTDTLPTGLTFNSFTGLNWNCSAVGQVVTCTRTNGLTAGADSTITLTVNVAASVADSVTNTATVTVNSPATNDINSTNNSASDPTVIIRPDLTVSKTHTGNFAQGSTTNTYYISVSNTNAGATTGTITLTDTLPTGLTATAISGNGWTCTLATLTCTRSDSLAGFASYPDITVTVTVAPDAPLSITNSATVSGGGENNTSNNTDTDVTTITGVDYGDAPDSGSGTGTNNYETLGASGGPSHTLLAGLRLGATIDGADNNTTQQNATATQDDNTWVDDEDGVTLPSLGSADTSYSATVQVTTPAGTAGYLVGWIDFNRNGVFETSEGVLYDADTGTAGIQPIAPGTTAANVNLTWTVPSGLTGGNVLYARFRLTDTVLSSANGTQSVGILGNGEVEDYALTVQANAVPNLVLVKRITAVNGNATGFTTVVDDGSTPNDNDPDWPSGFLQGALTTTAAPGDVVDYTIYFLNTGTGAASNVRICDPLSQYLTYIPNSYDLGYTPLTPNNDGGGTTNLGIALRVGGSTVYLTGSSADAPDRGAFIAANTVPANCSVEAPSGSGTFRPMTIADNPKGTITVNLGTVNPATGSGVPNTSYGYIRFRTTVD